MQQTAFSASLVQSYLVDSGPATESAELVLPCTDLDATLRFFLDELRFRLDAIFPADDPSVATISGHGLCIRVVRGAADARSARIRLPLRDHGGERELVAPDGTRVELVSEGAPLALPELEPSFVLTRATAACWGTGRAGMRYRDLIPDRQGGRFIGSHIRIEAGGPVPDYVHYHEVRFQMIYCYRGWVRVVYEDQGPPFVMEPGDCVLQPPGIRHRVLEASPGLEVVEIACPAQHMTRIEHDLVLPTPAHRPDRDFDGQRFVRHRASSVRWQPGNRGGFEVRDTGIEEATAGLASARVLRPRGAPPSEASSRDAELLFRFVLQGSAALLPGEGDPEHLAAGDTVVLPAGMAYALAECSPDLEMLEVRLPAR